MSSIYRKFFSPPRQKKLKKSRYGKKQIETAHRMRSNDIYRENNLAKVCLGNIHHSLIDDLGQQQRNLQQNFS
jgi:hypothetical protein